MRWIAFVLHGSIGGWSIRLIECFTHVWKASTQGRDECLRLEQAHGKPALFIRLIQTRRETYNDQQKNFFFFAVSKEKVAGVSLISSEETRCSKSSLTCNTNIINMVLTSTTAACLHKTILTSLTLVLNVTARHKRAVFSWNIAECKGLHTPEQTNKKRSIIIALILYQTIYSMSRKCSGKWSLSFKISSSCHFFINPNSVITSGGQFDSSKWLNSFESIQRLLLLVW